MVTNANCPPASNVSAGNCATGQTSNDDPTASIKPAHDANACARAIAASGKNSPNNTTSGFNGSPQSQ